MRPVTVAPARSYNRSDWASAFVNVEQELTDVALSTVIGAVPAELQGTFTAMDPTSGEGWASGASPLRWGRNDCGPAL